MRLSVLEFCPTPETAACSSASISCAARFAEFACRCSLGDAFHLFDSKAFPAGTRVQFSFVPNAHSLCSNRSKQLQSVTVSSNSVLVSRQKALRFSLHRTNHKGYKGRSNRVVTQALRFMKTNGQIKVRLASFGRLAANGDIFTVRPQRRPCSSRPHARRAATPLQ